MSSLATPGPLGGGRPRVDSLDLLRGIVMVLMLLDHTRDFWSPRAASPEVLAASTPGFFFTRWITHYCAPIFVFLAGCGAYLYAARGRTRGQLATFLLTRGLWLILLEIFVVNWLWRFSYAAWPGGPETMLLAQVIWAIGASFLLLAALCWLPTGVVAGIGVLIICGHNLLDGLSDPAAFAALLERAALEDRAWLLWPVWSLLHAANQPFMLNESTLVWCNYPLLPWFGILAAGYGFGVIVRLEPAVRCRWYVALGLGATLLFVVLRAANGYGDPQPWASEPVVAWPRTPSPAQRSNLFPLMSFLNCTKYPPSLLYTLMTLGPALLALAWFDRTGPEWPGSNASAAQAGAGVTGPPLRRWLVTFGRVPFLFYMLQWPLANAGGALYFQFRYGVDRWQAAMLQPLPDGYQPELWVTWAAWAGGVLLLYWPCRWFAEVKRRSRAWWLSYL